MKCSICDKEATYFKPYYRNNGQLELLEARCKNHKTLGKKEERNYLRKIKHELHSSKH